MENKENKIHGRKEKRVREATMQDRALLEEQCNRDACVHTAEMVRWSWTVDSANTSEFPKRRQSHVEAKTIRVVNWC